MYKRLSAFLFPVTAVALLGAGVWGYQENQEKNTILIKAENQYQRAFHDLSYHMDRLQTELGNTVAVNSASQDINRKNLVNIWRLTNQAQSEVGQLPLAMLPFNRTQEFLDNMANFSYRTAIRDLSKSPMSDKERRTLNALHQHARQITTDLRGVQTKVIASNLRWMDVETALAAPVRQQSGNFDNAIIDGFRTVDTRVSQYGDVDWGPSRGNELRPYQNMAALSGPLVTPQDARRKAAGWLGTDANRLKVVESGRGTTYNTYSVTGKTRTGLDVQLDLTKKGAQVVYFLAPRQVNARQLDLRGARDAAYAFLAAKGYPDMSVVSYDQYANTASLNFARRQNDVLIYPEKVTVQVALDNGDITGLQASDYLLSHKERKLSVPKLSVQEAQKSLNRNFRLTGTTLAVIRNDVNEEVLCHQFEGRVNGSDYKIFLNADTGFEEKIETIKPDEAARVGRR